MIEYQIVLNIYTPSGSTVKHVLRSTDRELAIEKFKYLGDLVTDKKRIRELKDWCADNDVRGQIVSTDGLFGVSYIKILP